MNSKYLKTLEFDQVRDLLVRQAGSVGGREQLLALEPLSEVGDVRRALGLTSEAVRLLLAIGRQPYHDLPDITAVLPRARVAAGNLEPAELLDVASFIEGATEIARSVSGQECAVELARRAASLRDTTEVATAIRRAILPGGDVADSASPRLAEIRRALLREKARLTSVMEAFLRGPESDRLLQEKLITTRNDRYVLLLKAEHRGQIPGIVHGSSGSGASLFVEPLPAVEINNDIVEQQDAERREVIRILQALTARVGDRTQDLAQAVTVLAELDARQAMATLAREMDAVEPLIAAAAGKPPGGARQGGIDLRQARHPLLMPHLAERLGTDQRSRRGPVPISIRAGFDHSVLVISGPNTGGKTVALKTLGLLALMAQCGLHIPAAEGSSLPVFRRVYADIGDDQSIASDLSTFSAHLRAIGEMAHDLALPALVLLDEVGAGTDPTEGGALGVAIVDHFRRLGALVVATTHHGRMNDYAQTTPGVACASFGYDPATYAPTYRLTLGTPGRSLAFEMAERLGLPLEVVADARGRLAPEEAAVDEIRTRLEKELGELEAERARVATDRLELDAARARTEVLERELRAKKRTESLTFASELRRRGDDAARKADEAIRAAVTRVLAASRATEAEARKARTEAIGAIREAQEEALRGPELDLPVEVETISELAPVVGGRVRLRSMAVTGDVLSLSATEAEVAVGGKRLRVPRAELVAVGNGSGRPHLRPPSAASAKMSDLSASPTEINIVGLRVDAAVPRVDKALDEAALADRSEVRVVHGHGEGKLRRAVAELLHGHPHVASWRLGAPREGGGGVTIVELKE